MHIISPKNIPVACKNGWLKGLLVPSTDSDVMVSAHFTERVLKDPKSNIIPARPKCIGFQAMARKFLSNKSEILLTLFFCSNN